MREKYGTGNKIYTAEDLGNTYAGGYKTMITNHLKALGQSGLIEPFLSNPVGKKAYAIVNHSRWIVECECKGASAVTPGGSFYCMDCYNLKNKNRPRPVVFPDNYKEIETELLKREKPMNRNWSTDETIKSLKAEVQ